MWNCAVHYQFHGSLPQNPQAALNPAQHFAAELVGRFRRERQGLAAVALSTDTSILTAIGNDYGFDDIFSRQIEALALPGDIVFGISTSGQSKNVIKVQSNYIRYLG